MKEYISSMKSKDLSECIENLSKYSYVMYLEKKFPLYEGEPGQFIIWSEDDHLNCMSIEKKEFIKKANKILKS